MDTALAEIYAFMQDIHPFDQLPELVLEKLVTEITICYVRAEKNLPPSNISDARIYILRKGALTY